MLFLTIGVTPSSTLYKAAIRPHVQQRLVFVRRLKQIRRRLAPYETANFALFYMCVQTELIRLLQRTARRFVQTNNRTTAQNTIGRIYGSNDDTRTVSGLRNSIHSCVSQHIHIVISPNSTWLVTSRHDTTRHVRRVEPIHFGCVELVQQHGSTHSTGRDRLA